MSSNGAEGSVPGLDDRAGHQRAVGAGWARRLAGLLVCGLLSACTTVGLHTRQRLTMDYGPLVQMRVCALQAPGVTTKRMNALIAAVNREFSPYGIEVVVPWVRPWTRSGFTYRSVFGDVIQRELEAPCDRLVVFVDRNAGDFLWGLVMPEVLGAVNDETHTHGFIVATRVSINQLFQSPTETAVHEFYHLLGCPHSGSLASCYGRIAALKRQFDPSIGFFPGIREDGRLLVTREAANAVLRGEHGYQQDGLVAAPSSATANEPTEPSRWRRCLWQGTSACAQPSP